MLKKANNFSDSDAQENIKQRILFLSANQFLTFFQFCQSYHQFQYLNNCMQSRKEDFIIQIGGEFLRVGLVSDKTPRKVLPAEEINLFRKYSTIAQYEIKVQEMLYSIFYTHINSTSLGKTVVLLEKVYTDRRIVEAITSVLFKKFKIEKIEFALSCITPLYLTGRFSGLVISGGATSVQIMPIFQSYPLMHSYKYIPTGTKGMIKLIKDEILLLNPQAAGEVLQKITDEYLNDLKNLYSNMNLVQAKSEDQITLNLKKVKLKLKPSSINYSNIFGNPDNEEYNIAFLALEVLSQLDNNIFNAVVSNVVLAGGLWRVKGMQTYFKKRIKQYLSSFKKLQNRNLADKIKFISWGFNPSQVSWIGCSVGSSIKAIQSLCLKRSDFETGGFKQKIMQNYFLSS